MTTCNFDVYCENGVLKGDGLCFVQCCSTGNICDSCQDIDLKYFIKDARQLLLAYATYVGPALSCSYPPPDLGYGGSWSCKEFYTIDGYTLTEVRCYYKSNCFDCADELPNIGDIVNAIYASCGQSGFNPGANYYNCCEGCCVENGSKYPADTITCNKIIEYFLGENGDIGTFHACGCDSEGPLPESCLADPPYAEPPDGEKIGGCCSNANVKLTLNNNNNCAGLILADEGEECPNEIGLSKICDKEPETVNIDRTFPDYCEIDYPTSITVDPETITSLPYPFSNCCDIECCGGSCNRITYSLLKKRIIGNKLKIKLNKAEIIRRIRNKIKIRKTK